MFKTIKMFGLCILVVHAVVQLVRYLPYIYMYVLLSLDGLGQEVIDLKKDWIEKPMVRGRWLDPRNLVLDGLRQEMV